MKVDRDLDRILEKYETMEEYRRVYDAYISHNSPLILNDIPRVEGIYGPVETELRARAGIEGIGSDDPVFSRERTLRVVLEALAQKHIERLRNPKWTAEELTQVWTDANVEMRIECEKHDAEVGSDRGSRICDSLITQTIAQVYNRRKDENQHHGYTGNAVADSPE
jgi:hypothetical protein